MNIDRDSYISLYEKKMGPTFSKRQALSALDDDLQDMLSVVVRPSHLPAIVAAAVLAEVKWRQNATNHITEVTFDPLAAPELIDVGSAKPFHLLGVVEKFATASV